MKFYRYMLHSMAPEWRAKYLDYKGLKKQVKHVKSHILNLAKAFSDIKVITGNEVEAKIDIDSLVEEQHFLQMLQENIDMVKEFYEQQLKSMTDQFYGLVSQCVSMGLMEEYIPLKKGVRSRVEREISRLIDVDDLELQITSKFEASKTVSRARAHSMFSLVKAPKNEEDDKTSTDRKNLKRKASIIPAEVLKTVELPAPEEDKKNKKTKSLPKVAVEKNFCEFYRGLILLKSYCELNVQALEKILKKHDKNLGLHIKDKWLKKVNKTQEFPHYSKLKILVSETETVFAQAFTGGHRTDAMKKLRIPEDGNVAASIFMFGLNTGITAIIAFILIYIGSISSSSSYPQFESVMIVYRTIGMVILLVWVWGIDLLIWERSRINYVFIFEFDARRHIRYQHLFSAASIFSLIWVISLFLYIIGSTAPAGFGWLGKIPWQTHPVLLLLLSLTAFIIYQVKSKAWLLITLFHIISSPFSKVQFRDFFLGDQLCSLSIVLIDLQYSLCFMSYDIWRGTNVCTHASSIYAKPIVAPLPYLWRQEISHQCLRRYKDNKDPSNIKNALKYVTAILVAFLSTMRANYGGSLLLYMWITMSVLSALYSYYWDIIRDWSLGNVEHKGLRGKLMYKYKKTYYFAMVANFVARCLWTLTISPQSIGISMKPLIFQTILAAVEIARRAMWNLFRLENEQLSNIGKFRAVNVEVPPLAVANFPDIKVE